MKRSVLAASALVATIVLFVSGCSKHDLGVAPTSGLRSLGALAPGDTTPKPHPGGPPDTSVVPATFLSADSTQAGASGTSRWLLGNVQNKSSVIGWALTADPSWPGFPIQGSQRIGPSRTAPLSVQVPVPASATSGLYTLTLTVNATPTSTYAALGTIRVFGNEPPPTPPPTPAVVFVGSDSVPPGATAHPAWNVFNESLHPFQMTWTLTANSAWPGFPKTGIVDLQGQQQQQIVVAVAVPDTASIALHSFEMTVTRPDGLPPQSSPGYVLVVPQP
jgi:hypothetical protein